MRRFVVSTLLLGVLLVVAGCSQTTQDLRLSPAPPATGPLIGGGERLGLEVTDTRTDRDLGMLENPDGSIVRLTAAQDVAYAVQLAAAEALRGYDFNPGLWDDRREPRLAIGIERLEHEVTAGVPYQLETRIALTATAWLDGERYTTRARTSLTEQRALPPRAATNTEVIEKAITRALDELLNEELARFLAGRR